MQEEPANMGALSFVAPRLKRIVGNKLRSIKRAANATPATGSAKAHELEQKTLITSGIGQRRVRSLRLPNVTVFKQTPARDRPAGKLQRGLQPQPAGS